MEQVNDTANKTISAVLPLGTGGHREGSDLQRAEQLFESLRLFAAS